MSVEASDLLDDLLMVTEGGDSLSSVTESVSSSNDDDAGLTSVRLSTQELLHAETPSVTPSTVSEYSDQSLAPSYSSDSFETLTTDRSIHTDEQTSSADYTYSDDFTTSFTHSLPSALSLDENRTRQQFFSSQIKRIKGKSGKKPTPKPEDPEQAAFCSQMARLLRRKSFARRESYRAKPTEKSDKPDIHIQTAFKDRVRIGCLLLNMRTELLKEEGSTELYQRSKMKEELAKRQFLQSCTERARSSLIDSKLHDPCYQDPIMMYAELVNSLPNPREPANDIWEQLLKPLTTKISGTHQKQPE